MVSVRAAVSLDALAIARVHARTWKEAYRGLLDPGYLAGLTEARLLPRWRRSLAHLNVNFDEAIFVAEAGEKVVGFISVGACTEAPQAWDGEISMLYVLDSHRRHGAGRALVKAAADHCIRRGLFTVGLWALENNALGRGFYQRLGGVESGRKGDSVGGRTVALTGFGWSDIALLAQRPRTQTSSRFG